MKQRELAKQKKAIAAKSNASAASAPTEAAAPTPTPTSTAPTAPTAPAATPVPATTDEDEVQEVSEDDAELQADINNEDDLLIPLANGWVCEKRRDITGETEAQGRLQRVPSAGRLRHPLLEPGGGPLQVPRRDPAPRGQVPGPLTLN
jgi:hypothetical protein